MVDHGPRTFADRLNDAIADKNGFDGSAADALRAYFRGFDGARFHDYDLEASHTDRITPGDLVAVTFLSMEISRRTSSGITPQMACAIEDLAAEITGHLRGVPSDRELHTLSSDEFNRWLGKNSPGERLWRILREGLRFHRVATYKLLARKRPHLMPIRDSAADRALGKGQLWWRPWWEALSSSPVTVHRLMELRSEVGLPELSLLRVADIVIWMRFNTRSAS